MQIYNRTKHFRSQHIQSILSAGPESEQLLILARNRQIDIISFKGRINLI